MALQLLEGFDHFTAAQATSKGWSGNFSTMPTGRWGGQAAHLGTSVGATISHALPSSYSTLIAGYALNYGTPGGANFLFRAAGSNTCSVGVNSSNLLFVQDSTGATVATGATVLVAGNWYYIEVKVVVGTSGSVELHLDGTPEIASTVGNFGSTNLDSIALYNPGGLSYQNSNWDDIYVLDTSGTDNNDFLGDVRVKTVWPNGTGSHSQWTPNGAASNYGCVDEAQADGDTTYVSSATPGDLDSYTFDDIDGGSTVHGIQINAYARKDDAATRQIALLIRQGGVDYVGSTITLSSNYAFDSQLNETDPTGAAWTAANVNGDEFGIKEVA